MWLCDRRHFLSGAGVSLLSACGFTPVYKQGGAASGLFNQIAFGVVEGRYGYELRERLIARLGAAGADARYRLTYELKIESRDLVVSETQDIIRYNLTGVADYTVADSATGETLFRDSVRALTAYSATSDTYPTTVAERDANIRLARTLADLMVTRLSVTAGDWAA
jgi:LPS-assembly lipoprotein